ncbi:hypothetical protein Tco_0959250 [Tanacetum coccineum]
MTTLAEHMMVAGAENRHSMLEKSMMMLASTDEGPLVYPTVVGEDGQTRPKKYSELTEEQQLQDDCDVQATNIILHGLPPDVYSLFNHQEAAKDIWDIVKLLMKGTELSYQDRECKLYNLFDKFASVQGETLYEYYWRFSQLINDMHTIRMTMQQVQVNTKFLNALPPEWSKFVTDVKLAKTPIHHQHHHTPVNPLQKSASPQLYISPSVTQQSQAEFPQLDSGLVVPIFQQGEDPIECINKAMSFISSMASRFPSSNNQLKTSSNLRNQATIQDAFQPEDLDAYDSNCDDISSVKAVLMANLSSYNSEVLSEVPYSDTYLNDMINQDVQEMPYYEQTHIVDFPDNEITSDSNIFPYSQYLQESQDVGIHDSNSSAPNDLLVLSMVEQMTNHVANLDKENHTNKIVNESLTAELERYKEHVAIFEQRLNVDLKKREN